MNAWYIDAIIAIVNEQRLRLENAMQYQPCGHPVTAATTADDGASHCQDCERLDRLMATMDAWQERNEAAHVDALKKLGNDTKRADTNQASNGRLAQ